MFENLSFFALFYQYCFCVTKKKKMIYFRWCVYQYNTRLKTGAGGAGRAEIPRGRDRGWRPLFHRTRGASGACLQFLLNNGCARWGYPKYRPILVNFFLAVNFFLGMFFLLKYSQVNKRVYFWCRIFFRFQLIFNQQRRCKLNFSAMWFFCVKKKHKTNFKKMWRSIVVNFWIVCS